MSGKNWLERDPKDSLGLQRIQEAQQAKIARDKKKQKKQLDKESRSTLKILDYCNCKLVMKKYNGN